MTYSLKINFSSSSGRRPYTRTGLDWEAAIGLKTYFIERVPCAVSGWVTPESEKEGKGK